MRLRLLLVLPIAALSIPPAAAAPHGEAEKGRELVTPTDLRWQDGPASLARGARMAVLEGDPGREGPFVMRVQLPDGFRIMPHTHPKDERVTVLSGTLFLGMGGKFDAKAARAMPAGSYGRTGAGMKHFGWVEGETDLQVHGTGPWAIEYVNPDDDPRKKK